MNAIRVQFNGARTVSETSISRLGLVVWACLICCALAAVAAPQAGAVATTFDRTWASPGSGAGQLSQPASLAMDEDSGHVYVAERGNDRIQELDEDGNSVRVFGFDVVASGPSDKPFNNEVQKITIKATGGTFRLFIGGEETKDIAFDAPASGGPESLEGRINEVLGGDAVSVTAEPADPGASTFLIEFDGPGFAGEDINTPFVRTSSLGHDAGRELSCEWFEGFNSTSTVKWLRNGEVIPGETATTYTTTAADEGKAVQCEIETTSGLAPNLMARQVSDAEIVAPTAGGTPPVVFSGASLTKQPSTTHLIIGSEATSQLTCNSTSWFNEPTSFKFEFLRNGVVIDTEVKATGTDTYQLKNEDLASAANFQCRVTATNASGSSLSTSDPSGFVSTREVPCRDSNFDCPELPEASGLSIPDDPSFEPETETVAFGGPVYEVCIPVAPTEDVCKAGVAGSLPGQFNAPSGVAVDNSGGADDGSIYVQDAFNARVQKFTPAAEFEREWGGFQGWGETHDNGVHVDSAGRVYVLDEGSAGDARLQRFDGEGTFLDQIRYNGTSFVLGNWETMTLDRATQDVYIRTPRGIVKYSADDFGTEGDTETQDQIITDETETDVRGLAFDESNGYLQVGDANGDASACPGESGNVYALRQFEPSGGEADCTLTKPPYAIPINPPTRGLLVSPDRELYVADKAQGEIHIFKLPEPEAPDTEVEVTGITSKTAILRYHVNPNFSDTNFRVEFGTAPCSSGPNACAELESGGPLRGVRVLSFPVKLDQLTPATTYYFRIIAENAAGETIGPDRLFSTFAGGSDFEDTCPNALARQQSRAALLLDCRAYELVSAGYAGGYDVRSDLVPGKEFFGGFPDANGKALYSVLDGGVPNAGGPPTNNGADPYIASRGDGGTWTTRYAGIPANVNDVTGPFSSTVAGAAPDLSKLAFGGPGICDPCFTSGVATGHPLRMPDGSLIQGMAGPLTPPPGAEPGGEVREHFSGDGTHFLFGSASQFHSAGNNNGTDVTIYDRNLVTGTTQVVSTTPGGTTMTGVGEGIAALDVSRDGSRVLVGRLVDTDAAGNDYWDLFMHVGSSPNSVAVADTPNGVLFGGMTEDGTQVLYATADQVPGTGDTDTSGDLFRAVVGAGSERLSGGSGGSGNGDGCGPAANDDGNNWNAVGGASPDDCGVVAIAAGGGVAEATGRAYFFSPERLDGASNGTDGEPNLYSVGPGQTTPQYVATLEPNNPAVRNGVSDSEVRRTADFQVAPFRPYAVFSTRLALDPTFVSKGHQMVYRHEAVSGDVECVSCSPTNESPTGDAALATDGLSLTDDGDVFFNSVSGLVLRDNNSLQDAYQWKDGTVQLISTGASSYDASLLSVTSDGRDAFFFTREAIVSADQNGKAMRLYDARKEGGVFVIPPSPPCAASDECHGPSSQAAPPPQIGTFKVRPPATQAGPACPKGKVLRKGRCVRKRCPKGKVRRRGKCVKKNARRGRKGRRTSGSRGRGR